MQIQVSRHPHGIRHENMGHLSPLAILGPPHHGGQGRGILCHSVQRVSWGHRGVPPLPHDLQHSDGLCDATLDNSCDCGRVRSWWLWEVGADGGGVFPTPSTASSPIHSRSGFRGRSTSWRSSLAGSGCVNISWIQQLWCSIPFALPGKTLRRPTWDGLWGGGVIYQVRLLQRVCCLEWATDLVTVSLASHRHLQPGIRHRDQWETTTNPPPPVEP